MAFETPAPTGPLPVAFTLIGVCVGVVPVFLGLLWYPALRALGRRGFGFLMGVTAGLLLFLGVDALAEALEAAAGVAGPFQGVALAALGAVLAFLLLEAVRHRQPRLAGADEDDKDADRRRSSPSPGWRPACSPCTSSAC